MTSLTTLTVEFVSESAGYRNTFGWYNKRTGIGGILFGSIEAEGRNPTVRSGDKVSFTVDSSDVGDIEYFLIPNGGDSCNNSRQELSGPVKVIQLANGSWAVASADSQGNLVTDARGRPNVLGGDGANALFTQTTKNAGGVDYASSAVGSNQTAAKLVGDTADGATGLLAWEDLAATKNRNGTYSKPGDADYNDAVFRISSSGAGNRPPVAANDTAAVQEDGSVLIDVLANDSDPDGNPLTILAGSIAATNGVAILENGRIRYTPAVNFNGSATISYQVTDGTTTSSVATVAITVTPVNDVATIGAPSVSSVTEDAASPSLTANGTLSVTDLDTGEAGFRTTVASAAGNLGTLTLAVNGNYAYSVANAAVQHLGAGQTKIERFTVTSIDGSSREISFTVLGVNDTAAIAGTATGSVAEDEVTVAGGTLSISDADAGEAQFRPIAPAALAGAYGTFTFDAASGAWSYALANGSAAVQGLRSGQIVHDTLAVMSLDGTATRTIDVTIAGTNDAASISGTSIGQVIEDDASAAAGALSIGDMDAGEAQFRAIASAALAGTYGTFTFDATVGTWSYALANGSAPVQGLRSGQTVHDTLTVTSLDGTATHTIDVAIAGTNDGPIAFVDSGAVAEAGKHPGNTPFAGTASATGNVLGNDVDVDLGDTLSVQGVVHGEIHEMLTNGVGAPIQGTYGTLTIAADGTYKYALDNSSSATNALAQGQSSKDVFSYTVRDEAGLTSTSALAIEVTGTNDAPVIGPVRGTPLRVEGIGEFGVQNTPVALGADTYRLTPDVGNVAGAVWGVTDLSQNQFWQTRVYLGDELGGIRSGADGIAFTLQSQGVTAITALNTAVPGYHMGGNLGVGGIAGGSGLPSAFGVWIDTWANPGAPVEALGANSISFFQNDPSGTTRLPFGQSTPHKFAQGLENGQWHDLIVSWNAASQMLSFTFTLQPSGETVSRTQHFDPSTLPAGPVYFGFAASTGSAGNLQQVQFLNLGSPVVFNVQESTAPLSVVGAITFADPDTGDSPEASYNPATGATIADAGAVLTPEQLQAFAEAFTISPAGAWTFNLAAPRYLAAGDTVTAVYTIVVTDDAGATATQDISITVNGTGSSFVASVTEDRDVNEAGNLVSAGRFAVDNAAFIGVESQFGNIGSLVLGADGSYVYAVANAAVQSLGDQVVRSDTFVLRRADGSTRAVVFDINGVNDAPVAVGEVYSINENQPLSVFNFFGPRSVLLLNDQDTDFNSLSVEIVSGPAHGTLAVQDPLVGSFSYTPDHNFFGQDSFTYRVYDGIAYSNVATASINVYRAVFGSPDGYATTEDMSLSVGPQSGVLGNDVSSHGDPLAASLLFGPQHGALQFNDDGSFEYTPVVNYTGPDSFTYVARDPGASSFPTEVRLFVHAVNDAPVAVDDTALLNTRQTTSVSGLLLSNDTDVDNDRFDLRLSEVRAGAEVAGGAGTSVDYLNPHASVSIAGAHGVLTINGFGGYAYVPDGLLVGTATDTFTYTVRDPSGATDTAELTIHLSGDQPPIAIDDNAMATALTGAFGDVRANDIDGDDALTDLTVTAIRTGGEGETGVEGAVGGMLTGAYGWLQINSDGAYTYLADAGNPFVTGLLGAETLEERFTYTISDPFGTLGGVDTAELVITIGANQTPAITGNLSGQVQEDNAVFASGVVALSGVPGLPMFQSVAGAPTTYGHYSVDALGEWLYTLDNASAFVQSLGAYEELHDFLDVRDASNLVNASIDITVYGSNDAPLLAQSPINFALNGFFASEGGSGWFTYADILFSEIDRTDSVHFVSAEFVSSNYGGQVGSFSAGILNEPSPFFANFGTLEWSFSIFEDDYQALLGTVSEAAETWRITLEDENGGSVSRDITIQIVGNAAPSSFDQSLDAQAGQFANGQVLGFDPEASSLRYLLASGPAHGWVYLDEQTGLFTYQSNADYSGADSFTYLVSDGQTLSRAGTISVSVDQAPVVNAFAATIPEDSYLVAGLTAYDAEGDTLQYLLSSAPQFGSVAIDPVSGLFTYAPNPDFNGFDSFTYSAFDGLYFSEPAVVTIEVTPDAGDAPIVPPNNDVLTFEDTSSPAVYIGAYDPDGDDLIYSVLVPPAHGTLELFGNTLVYTPEPDDFGSYSFKLLISDGTFEVEQNWIVNILGVSDFDSLTAAPDLYAIDADQLLIGNVLGNDTNADGDTIGAIQLIEVSHGTLLFSGTGDFSYAPDPTFSGEVTFTYLALAADGDTSQTSVTIAVSIPPNFAPTVESVHVDGTKGAVTPLVLTGADYDGVIAYFQVVDPSAASSFYLDAALTQPIPADGRIPATGNSATLYFMASPGAVGAFGFEFVAVDDGGKPSYATAQASVLIHNEVPVASNLVQSIIPGDAAAFYGPQAVIPIEMASFYPFIGSSHIVIDPAALPGTLYLDAGLTQAVSVDGVIPIIGATTTMYFVPDTVSGPTILPYELVLHNGHTLRYAAPVGSETGVPITLLGSDTDGVVSEFVLAGFALPVLANQIFYFDADLTQPIGDAQIPAVGNAATIYVAVTEYITLTAMLREAGVPSVLRYAAVDDSGATSPLAEINLSVSERPQTADIDGALLLPGATLPLVLQGSDDGAVGGYVIVSIGAGLELYAEVGGAPLLPGAIVGLVHNAGTGQLLPNVFARAQPGYTGSAQFQVAAIDNTGLADLTPATVTINVAGTGSAPTPAGLSIEVEEDHQVGLLLSGSDTDYASFVSSFRILDVPEHGRLLFVGAFGQTTPVSAGDVFASPVQLPLRFIPDPDFSGTTSFRYEVIDVTGETSLVPATVTISVAPLNDAPFAADQLLSTPINAVLHGQLAAIDADGDPLTFALAPDMLLQHGTLSLNGDGTFTYVPEPGFKGFDIFSFTVSDGQEVSGPAYAVLAVDSAPVSQSLVLAGDEDAPIAGQLVATDADGDPIQFILLGGPEHGYFTAFNSDGTFVYQPYADYFGVDSFTYASSDGLITGNTATVALTVAGVNDAPTVSSYGGLALPANAEALFVQASAFDADSVLSITVDHVPEFGEVRIFTGPDPLGKLVSVGDVLTAPEFSSLFFLPGSSAGRSSFDVTISDGIAPPLTHSISLQVLEPGADAENVVDLLSGMNFLIAGDGKDHFVFSAADSTAMIMNFAPGVDSLDISASALGGNLSAGGSVDIVNTLNPFGEYHVAQDGYFLFASFDGNIGTLYWDPTGGDASDLATLAIIQGTGALHPNDFHIVT